MKKVRFGVIGLGTMGSIHCDNISKARSRDFCLAAVCDVVADRSVAIGTKHRVPHFTRPQDLIDSGLCDAILSATPHYWHAPNTFRAARAGLHVLCEKPLAATVGPARAMIAECRKRKVALGIVFHYRTRAIMRKVKQIVDSGRIGEVFRLQMICSNWFRTQAYYDSGAWRGTWDGEGGGVLLNQAPHHLDLFQWIGGMPKRIKGSLSTRAHKIEVEDTANFILEYEGGKIGYIYATTAEEPGYEQLMICGDKGTLICEKEKICVSKLKTPVSTHIMKSTDATAGGAERKVAWSRVKVPKRPEGHIEIVRAFAAHILRGSDMLCTGAEGINQLELTNGMYIAGHKDKTVELPVDAGEIDRLIAKLEAERSTGKGMGFRKKSRAELRGLMKKRT